jgi:isopentenyldiphosphate isomerase
MNKINNKNQSIITATQPEELLYLVNKKNKVIGSIIRKVANTNPLFIHREIGIIIYNKNREILLQKRSLYKKVHPGMWSITAGHITYGLTPSEAAKKELAEELGLDLKLIHITTRLNEYSHESHFMYYYLCFYQGKKDIKLEKAEVTKTDFFSPNKLKKLQKKERVNLTHLPVLNKYWQGEFQEAEKKLSK